MGEWVQVQGPDGVFKAYLARPAGQPKAALVAIQEIFGINAVMRKKADWLASEGYLAIAPALFDVQGFNAKVQAHMPKAIAFTFTL